MDYKKSNLEYEIIEALMKSESHVRDISKKLNAYHSTILRKLNELKEKNVIGSKREGRNRIFFLKENIISKNQIIQTEAYKTNNLLQKNPQIKTIAEEILKKTNKSPIIIFGSYAKGTQKKDSDIDIYIETQDKKTKEEIEKINSKLSVKIGPFKIDSPLVKEIIKNHIIIRGFEEFYEKSKLLEKSE